MSEWWTYRLSSFLLFSPRTYSRLFELHNAAIWPSQIVALALGVAILVLAKRPGAWRGRAIAAILAACWGFVAWAFHYRQYATINWAATYFAIAFGIEALLIGWIGIARGALPARSGDPLARRMGLGAFIFALVVQPALGLWAGRHWTQVELLGVAPDPTVVATMGLLLGAARMRALSLLVPLLWCAVSGAFAWAMARPDALVMPLAGLVILTTAAVRPVRPSLPSHA